MTPRGWSLVELVVGLALTGLVAVAAHRALAAGHRAHRWQSARAERSAVARDAMAILPGELRGLDATDSAGSDIVALSSTSITYKAVRALRVLCRAPVVADARSGTLVVAEDLRWGTRGIDPPRDSLLIFAEADPTTPEDDYWVRAQPAALGSRLPCPGGKPGLSLGVRHAGPSEGLRDVRPGAPVYAQELMQLEAYADRQGDWWLGARQHAPGRGWGRIQPVLGPLAPEGLRLAYYDPGGAPTGVPREVARIDIRLVVGSGGQAPRGARHRARTLDTLVLSVALRGNRRGSSRATWGLSEPGAP
jgi:hypothetical protein